MVEELLRKLEKNVERATEKGVQWTARYAPLYGQIARLRSAMERWTGAKVTGEWVERAVGACWTVSRLVNEVFADHTQDLSMDRSVLIEDDAAPTAQMLYVCCWRCIREVSLFLTELLTGRLVPSASLSRIQEVFLWSISQLFMTRHTGTFETLAEQIHKLSVLLVEKHGEAGKAVVVSSLGDIVEEVTGAWSSPLQPENTRRSAGVPRLWCILYRFGQLWRAG
ncbi:thyroid adenoma-associated protein homolog [Paramacrobiotus metropolitanus]|uniref:thyroid adenoma-associated protein homolog n=1 Tax=Paramacrobiotus metropolitanus TaxID=2943436 RepID=UPI0024462CBE|nr:thyroid adenoma-associated protein homolog [Paramacrobiotus metropolitanus]XP_055351589.1 thyroid adenoma-associated protein homolog [Paramacrobiotus metropolitanus]